MGPFAVAIIYICEIAETERQRLCGGVIIHSYSAGVDSMLVRLLSSSLHTVHALLCFHRGSNVLSVKVKL